MARKQFFSNKIIEQIKEQISILDVAVEFGLTPVRKGQYYTLQEHDSVLIYPDTNSFFRHKNSIGGDVFAFAKEIEEINMSFKDFYFHYLNKIDRTKNPLPIDKKIQKPKNFMDRRSERFDLNESLARCEAREKKLLSQIKIDNNFRNVRAFLIQTRKINPEIVNEFINKGLIKQGYIVNNDKVDFRTKLALFFAYNDVGFINAVNVKSTSSKGGFKGDLNDCNYAYGWKYDPDIKDYRQLCRTEFYDREKTLICFEGYVDMLAYISTLKEQGMDYRKYAYMTCGSTTKFRSVIAACITNHYTKVICAFDNDEAGDIHAVKIYDELKQDCVEKVIVTRQKSFLKDWDEDRQQDIRQRFDDSYFEEISIESIRDTIDLKKTKSIKEMKELAKKELSKNDEHKNQFKQKDISSIDKCI